MKLLDESPRRRSSRAPLWVGLLALALGAGVWLWLGRAPSAPEPPAPSATTAAVPDETQPRAGSVEITADRPGASVYLDGARLGAPPVRVDDVTPGSHHVRVELEGRPAIEREVHVLPGKVSSVAARFGAAPPRLRVTTDVDGASVFLDRRFIGHTPLETDIDAGSYTLQVSIEALPPHSEVVELIAGRTLERRIRLKEQPPLEVSIEVEHQHGLGKCRGTLLATDAGLEYRSDHKDAFATPLADLERFEFDYLEKNLNVKVRGGRRYNFRGEPDALLVFHREVEARLSK